MKPAPARSVPDTPGDARLADALRAKVRGDVRFDALARTIYSTDASIYEMLPAGVVIPKDPDDVVATLTECRKYGTPIIPRGAATGLAGGTVGSGVQLDLSRYLTRIGPVDRDGRTVDVQAGVVLDELNAHLAPSGLFFAPDVATSSRATIGGMIANNSCGARSVVYGRTVDHVAGLTVVTADGSVLEFGERSKGKGHRHRPDNQQIARLEDALGKIRDGCYDEIQRRFPKILRSNGGYGLDRLGPPGTPAEAYRILCGSEGTLGIVVSAKLKLLPRPKYSALFLLHFHDLLDSLAVTPAILRHKPSAVELIDRLILDGGRSNAALRQRCGFLQGDPAALLVVEFLGESDSEVAEKVEALSRDAEVCGPSYATARLFEPGEQADVWEIRKAGLGLLMSKPGDRQPHAFVEDTAVDPARLRDYIERFSRILDREQVSASYYAHASVGCLHVRPVVSLKQADDVARMRRIAEAVGDLAVEFGGTVTGEHGDGIVRSGWLERMYGPRIMAAFKEVKRLFDPDNLLNPNKIVDPFPMTQHLRYGRSYAAAAIKTHLDFTAHGGMAGLAEMCSGVGRCRQRLVGTMCPSYMATGEEKDTTRARANALRVALSNRGLLEGLDDPRLAEVMELCISCKACKTECPTGVDMARLKAEYLSHRHLLHGVPRRARLVARMPQRLSWAACCPRTCNLLARSKPLRWLMEQRYGLDRRIAPPHLAHQTFRSWFRRYQRQKCGRALDGRKHKGRSESRADAASVQSLNPSIPQSPRVVYFVDTWTNYYTPQVGIATVKLLEAAGYTVVCPPTVCCGRPAISQGLLAEAKEAAAANIRDLVRLARDGVPIVGTEPSCILTLADEYPQLVRGHAARAVAEQVLTLESFLARRLREDTEAIAFTASEVPLLYHGHCHQKAIVGTADAKFVMRHIWGEAASEINSGCCGMAGVFGHEVEHYEVAKAIGEQRLFPAVRERGDARIAVSGFSCRQQIEHHTDAQPRHLAEYLAEAVEQVASVP